jgi:hypothetical protein
MTTLFGQCERNADVRLPDTSVQANDAKTQQRQVI